MYCLVPIAPLGSTSYCGLATCDASMPSKLVTVWACAMAKPQISSRPQSRNRVDFSIVRTPVERDLKTLGNLVDAIWVLRGGVTTCYYFSPMHLGSQDCAGVKFNIISALAD